MCTKFMDIESRFLIRDTDKVNELKNKYKDSQKTIVQDYIYSDIFTAIRKRMLINGDVTKYLYTVKTGRSGLFSVNEFENEITQEQYELLKKDENRITIEKDRYFIPYEEGLIIELDVFHGVYEGVVFAEIEFKSEEQAKSIKLPYWFDTEIGNKISNDMMSRKLIDFSKGGI